MWGGLCGQIVGTESTAIPNSPSEPFNPLPKYHSRWKVKNWSDGICLFLLDFITLCLAQSKKALSLLWALYIVQCTINLIANKYSKQSIAVLTKTACSQSQRQPRQYAINLSTVKYIMPSLMLSAVQNIVYSLVVLYRTAWTHQSQRCPKHRVFTFSALQDCVDSSLSALSKKLCRYS